MKRFNMLDEEFICENCHKKVSKLKYSARDHCNFCLYSLHVDILPGDRKNTCHGLLKPIDIEKYRDKVDLLIVAMHWGEEYMTYPVNSQKEIAKYLSIRRPCVSLLTTNLVIFVFFILF